MNFIKNKLEVLVLCFTISFSLCSAQEATKTDSEVVSQLKNFEQEILRLFNDLNSESSQKSLVKYSVEQYGEFSKLLTIFKDWFEFSKKTSVEIKKLWLDLNNVIIPEKLCSHEDINKAKDFVKSFSEQLTQYQKAYNENLDLVKKRIKDDFLENESLKTEILKGLENGQKMSQEVLNGSISIAQRNAQNLNELLNFLSEKSGTYTALKGIFMFEKSEDLDAYNKISDSLNKDKAEADVIVKKSQKLQQSVVQELESNIKE